MCSSSSNNNKLNKINSLWLVEQAGEAEGRKTENFGHHGILFGFLCLIVTYRNVTKIRRQVWTETVVVMATPWQ